LHTHRQVLRLAAVVASGRQVLRLAAVVAGGRQVLRLATVVAGLHLTPGLASQLFNRLVSYRLLPDRLAVLDEGNGLVVGARGDNLHPRLNRQRLLHRGPGISCLIFIHTFEFCHIFRHNFAENDPQ
jgi:hypothetical protein